MTLLTLTEAAETLRVSVETLRRALLAGTAQGVTGYRVGRVWRVRLEGEADGGDGLTVLPRADQPRARRAAGVPMPVIAATLGHSSLRVTADLYAHVTPDLHAEAAAKVAEALR